MISRSVLSLVLLVSCAHALVHVYELSLPCVEQHIADEYFADDSAAGKALTGRLSNAWRLMWGFGAILAGWLVDRIGGRRMLAIFLLGCAGSCAVAALSFSKTSVFFSMLLMGAFASIYHPAGLALISHETNRENRPRALGIHGIFGSAGIGLTPLLAGGMLAAGYRWREVYWCLMIPGALLGLVFAWQAFVHRRAATTSADRSFSMPTEGEVDWRSFFILTGLAALQGFVYSALMSFLPRYLGDLQTATAGYSRETYGDFLAAGVLLFGCIGQELAGRFARPAKLERQLTIVTFGNVPFLVWMAVATGWNRPVSAALLALVHFMHQPLYNSLIAKYTPQHHRSLCYGFSFAMGLGLGSFGAGFAGASQSDTLVYGALAAVAVLAGCVGWILCRLNPISAAPNEV